MEQQDAQQSKVWSVDTLRSAEEYPPGDAWISITDAARITRTSEAMARRWVSSGRIPVKSEPVGINARTRLVRISDVAAIRPVIDPGAAITDEVRLVDLPSIPKQMQEISENHQQLEAKVGTLRHLIEQSAIDIRTHMHQGLDDLELRVNTRQDRLTSVLETQIQELTAQFAEQLGTVGKLVEAEKERVTRLANHVTEQDRAIVQRLDENTQRLTQELEAIKANHQQTANRLDALVTAFGEHIQVFNARVGELSAQMQRLATDLPVQIEQVRTTMQSQLEQQVKNLYAEIHQLAQDEAHDAAQFTKQHEALKNQVGAIGTKAEATHLLAMNSQRRMDEANATIVNLQKQLNEERAAREVLTQQIQVLLQHVNTPHAKVEDATSQSRRRKTT